MPGRRVLQWGTQGLIRRDQRVGFGVRERFSLDRPRAKRPSATIEIRRQPTQINIENCPRLVIEQLVGLRITVRRESGSSYSKPYPKSVEEARRSGWPCFGFSPRIIVAALKAKGVAGTIAANWINNNVDPKRNITFELDAAEFV